MIHDATVVDRHGHLVRLAHVEGWLRAEDLLTPCSKCGGWIFFIGRNRLGCIRCVKRDGLAEAQDIRINLQPSSERKTA